MEQRAGKDNNMEQLKAITDHLPLLIAYVDSSERFLYVNKPYARWYGRSRSELIGKTLKEILYPESYTGIQEYIQQVLNGNTVSFENISYDLDGKLKAVKATYVPHKDNRGEVKAFIGVVEDISDQKNMERQINESLQEKEILLRELYHRTKNNMQMISALLALRASRLNNKHVNQFVSEIEIKIRTMALIHEKLFQSKDLSRINLDDYLHDLVKLMQQSFPMSKEKIRFQMIFEPLQVMIDTAIPFGLIVNELISNAYKYAFPEEQQGEIAISLKRDAEGQIHFTFSDNGVGIPNGFDVRKAGSIGLQTVCAIVEKQMKGNVEFENGRGLTVRIRFKERIYRSGI